MAKPQIVQLLSHGKALCRKAFSGFVDTFNYAVRRIDNLSGDGDGENAQGNIHVDNSDPEHPVIRFKKTDDFNVEGADGSGVTVSGNVIDLSGRGKTRMAVRDLTVMNADGHSVSIKVLSSAIDDDDRAEEEEEEEKGDDGHETEEDQHGEEKDPAERQTEEADIGDGVEADEGVPDGGTPACGDGGGVGGGGFYYGGVLESGGGVHSGDGCTGC